MATTFATSLGSKLAERWLASLLTPAFVFWVGGIAAWLYCSRDWTKIITQISQLSDFWKIALIVGSLLVVVTSAVIVEQLDLAVIRFLEGYWSRWLLPLRNRLIQQKRAQLRCKRWRFACLAKKRDEGLTVEELERYWASYYFRWLRSPRTRLRSLFDQLIKTKQTKIERLQSRQQFLNQKLAQGREITALTAEEWEELETLTLKLQAIASRLQGLTPQEEEQLARLDWQIRQAPTRFDRLMPTSLGNLLRVAETRPQEKYGLDAILCWSRLWLVLPDNVRKDIQEARTELNTGARIWLWSVLFTLWGVLAWWAVPMGLLSALFAYRWMLNTAATYGDLVEATFDLHRTQLYKALRCPLPKDPKDELKKGSEITSYLLGDVDQEELKFVQPESKEN
jgi:hypothetical protein